MQNNYKTYCTLIALLKQEGEHATAKVLQEIDRNLLFATVTSADDFVQEVYKAHVNVRLGEANLFLAIATGAYARLTQTNANRRTFINFVKTANG